MAAKKTKAGSKTAPAKAAAAGTGAASKKVDWDDANMKTTFANVVNGTSTREEMSLFFGTNNTWNVKEAGAVKVELSDRIILTPHAAKRLAVLLAALVTGYEKKYGAIKIDLPTS